MSDKPISTNKYTSSRANQGPDRPVMKQIIATATPPPKAGASSKTVPIAPKQDPKIDVNTIDSDEEPDRPARPVIQQAPQPKPVMPEHNLLTGKTSSTYVDRAVTQVTQTEMELIKRQLKEVDYNNRQDFHAIMGKLNTLEIEIKTIQQNIEIFKKSSARFVSSGPNPSVAQARKFDF